MANYADYATNNTNPFYLHPSETPAVVLVTPPLEGNKNFQSWIRSMRVALISKNKLAFVDGTITTPARTDPIYNQWIRCNSMVIAWLQRSVSANVLKSIVFFSNAHDAWTDLHERFDQGDMFRIADIQEDICRLSQGSLNISDYYSELKALWDELDNFRPLPQCKCAIPCTCGAVQSMRLFRDQDYTIRFLKGLNEQYAHVRSQIMMMDPFPPISKAFSIVTQQERQFHTPLVTETETEVKALAVHSNQSSSNFNKGYDKRGGFNNRGRGRHGSGGRGQGNRLCTHCGKTNHIIDTCYFLHGFPPGYQTRNNKPVNSAHMASSNSVSEENDKSASDTASNNVSLTQEQYKGLMDLLQQSKLQGSTASHSANTAMTHFSNSVTSNPIALNTNSNFTFDQYQEDDWYS